MSTITAKVKNHVVELPTGIELPDGTEVQVVWTDPPEGASKPPYDRTVLDRREVAADLSWATGTRFDA